jgi:RNase P subunit RPR2
MIFKPERKNDRRKVNRSVLVDRRGTKLERRRCPKCKGPLETRIHRMKGGSKTSTVCLNCGWLAISEQIDAHLIPD